MILKKIETIDQIVLLAIQQWRRPYLNKLFLILTFSGTGRAWFAFSLLLNILNYRGVNFIQNQNGFMRALLAPLLAWILGSGLKRMISRKRPSSDIKGFQKFINPPACGSFPSSHAAAAFSFFAALLMMAHPLSLAVGIWAILVSFSRLYLGVHYLSDVLAGFLLGTGCAFASSMIFL